MCEEELHGKDKRGREWELFCDQSYWDFWCVRVSSDRDFNSPTSFHFMKRVDAVRFLNLIRQSS